MILSDTQRKILLAVVMQANASEAEMARLLGIREHIVRRTVRMFLERKIFIQRSAFVNPFVLGLTHHSTKLSLPLESQKYYLKFRDILASVDGSVAVIEHGGAHALELRTYSHGLSHLQSIFETIAKQFSHPFHIHESLTILEHEYPGLSPSGQLDQDRPILGFGPLPAGSAAIQLEERDHAILFALCNSKYMSWNQVARELSMPTSTLIHRIANLEKKGVIQGHYYVLDVKVFNDLPVLLQVSSRVLKEDDRLAIREFCRLHPKIAWMSILLGSISAEILVRVQSHEEARAIMSDISDRFVGMIDRVYMTPPLKFFKWSDYPFKKFVPFGVA